MIFNSYILFSYLLRREEVMQLLLLLQSSWCLVVMWSQSPWQLRQMSRTPVLLLWGSFACARSLGFLCTCQGIRNWFVFVFFNNYLFVLCCSFYSCDIYDQYKEMALRELRNRDFLNILSNDSTRRDWADKDKAW